MFKVNDYVMYATAGVCQVQKVDYPDFLKDGKRKYYFLKPLHSMCDIFVPVDTEVKMRKVLSREEANELLEQIPNMEEVWVEDDSSREAVYKEAIQSFDCRELLKIIKCLYLKISERKKEGKKPLQMDEKYMNTAEQFLYGELSVVLDIPMDEVSDYITKKVQQSTAT
ncbi:CarD family transcriptional regulator [Christensenellaceae bacterium OttesenSCG-928-K19]|nr:CarD family transcriptional regulator [Christensenellaceae bacterium OttesenSCG-928-K19]